MPKNLYCVTALEVREEDCCVLKGYTRAYSYPQAILQFCRKHADKTFGKHTFSVYLVY